MNKNNSEIKKVNEIRKVEVQSYNLAAELKDQNPRNVLACKFSVPFALATTLVNLDSGVLSFTESMRTNEKIRKLCQKITVIEDKKMNREYIKPDFDNIRATLKLSEMFYDSSFSSIQKIPFRYKFSIIVARRIYRQIGRKILQKGNMENYEKSGKIYVNNFEKIYQTIISLFDLILIYLREIEPHQRNKEHAIISQEVDLDERI